MLRNVYFDRYHDLQFVILYGVLNVDVKKERWCAIQRQYQACTRSEMFRLIVVRNSLFICSTRDTVMNIEALTEVSV